jgi:hypothetical protein
MCLSASIVQLNLTSLVHETTFAGTSNYNTWQRRTRYSHRRNKLIVNNCLLLLYLKTLSQRQALFRIVWQNNHER